MENGEEESFRVNPSFSWKPRFVEAGLSGAKLPAWRESTFLARLLSWLLLVLQLRGGYCARL